MSNVHGITWDEIGRLGVDENHIEERITLAWWVNAAVVLGGVSTFVLAVLGVLKFCGVGG
jgi:hypothetical protein